MGNYFRPVQFGFGTKQGAEIIVHSAREFLQTPSTKPRAFLKFDFANAFNTVRRDKLMEKVFDRIPAYYNFVRSAYGEDSVLFCISPASGVTIPSASGVQQGDPCAPMFYGLLTQDVCSQIKAETNLWFLDDGVSAGDPQVVKDDMVNLQEAAAAVGLRLNTAKCELFVDGGTPAERENVAQLFLNAVPDIRISKPEELELLGSPLLSEAIAGALMRKVGQAQVLADQLGILPSHQAFFLLKNCLSLPKLLYILRTSPCWQYPEELRKFDDVIRFKAEQLTNVAMSDTVWNQASLPTKFGGLGLISATEVALAAYTSSVHGAVDMVCNVTRNESIKDRCNRLIEVWTSRFSTEPPRTESRRFQSAWTTPQHTQTASRMMENADVITSARLLAASSSESRAWLSALPVSLFGNLLEDAHLRIAVARRLGAPVCEQHVCRCGNVVDSLGHHGLVCKLAKGRHGVHAVLNDVTKRALNSARMPSSLEPPGLDRGDGKDQTELPFSLENGKPLVWDVTVADTFAQTYIARTSRVPGSAAEARENHKLGKYDGLADRYVVQPIAFETTGTFGPLTKKFFKELSRKISDCTGNPRSGEFLRQKISIEIQRGNAVSVLGTFNDMVDNENVFFAFKLAKRE
ncbi:uncharacterized protein LOC129600635 [Paramacrobiotus metropolitanus]|uniref:uncharacterized protein LOC129600635 n=1 Tax=Paramacrobiotus metropolitanus TaxID=2943436 RepID=UPI0024457A6E|nr:uncharacterized protein LOC129600635 [Paramacrobiotus metropolitanus]